MHAPHAVAPDTPTSADLAQQTLGEIAVALPGATAVFRRLKLDFCCGGQVRLTEACAAKGLDADALVSELQALVRDDATPVTPEPGALVDHIVQVATTGQTGDGLVWVNDVQRAVFIRKTVGPDS